MRALRKGKCAGRSYQAIMVGSSAYVRFVYLLVLPLRKRKFC